MEYGNENFKKTCLAIILSLVAATNGFANEKPEDCAAIWEMYRTELFKGDRQALATFSFGIASPGFVLPGTNSDTSALNRYGLNFSMYSLDLAVDDTYKMALGFAATHNLLSKNSPVKICLKDRNAPEVCIKIAQEKKLIMKFEELVEEIQYFESRPGGNDAYCSHKGGKTKR